MNFQMFSRVLLIVFLSGSLSACAWWGWGEEEVLIDSENIYEETVKSVDEKGNVLEVEPPVVVDEVEEKDQIIDEEWVSMTVPARLADVGFTLEAEIKKKVSTIEVVWTHPKTQQEGSYTLKQFAPGDNKASYNILAQFENFLPGLNEYEMIGRLFEDDPENATEMYSVPFQVIFDLDSLAEIQPEFIEIIDLPEMLQDEELELEGVVTLAVDQMHVYSWHNETGKSTFTRLQKFDPEKRTFQYFGKELFGNLIEGENHYVIDAVNADGDVVARKKLAVSYKKTTLEDTVQEYFGGFERNDQGWFTSLRYPWFSVHTEFEPLLVPEGDENLKLPRPSLRYTSQSKDDQGLCDYLAAIDYQADENVIYKGYSFEKCQTFRYGVSLYERYLSGLKYSADQLVSRTDYNDASEKVSTSFLMIENPRSSNDDADMEMEDTIFVYQMMIQENESFQEDQIGEIEIDMTDDQRDLFEDVQSFLNQHTGQEMFGWLLPESTSDLSDE
ncbi:MAG: hypothetical protein P1V18_05580 [Candidatus Gracilibacteria bacterium]|nr:hypothetical protein [Candidatus Gracilibacteria bacterium]